MTEKSRYVGEYPPQLPVKETDGLILETRTVGLDSWFAMRQIKDTILTARANVDRKAARGRLAPRPAAVDEEPDDEPVDDEDNTTLVPVVTEHQQQVLVDILTVYRTRAEFWRGVLRDNDPETIQLKAIAGSARKLQSDVARLAAMAPVLADDVAPARSPLLISALSDLTSVDDDGMDEQIRNLASELHAKLAGRPVGLASALPSRHSDLAEAIEAATKADDFSIASKGHDDETKLELVSNLAHWWHDVTGSKPTFGDKSGGRGIAGKASPYLMFFGAVLSVLPDDVRPTPSKGSFGVSKSALSRHWKAYGEAANSLPELAARLAEHERKFGPEWWRHLSSTGSTE